MRLLTINTHSLIEEDYERKLLWFVDMLVEERPDILAMQEVSQMAQEAEEEPCPGYVSCEGFSGKLRNGNHAVRLAQMLRERGLAYHWTWLPIKLGYETYDEGLVLFSLAPIRETRQFLISQVDDYANWKTRKVLGIRTGAADGAWFYTVHMGWWDDEEEPFATQWDCLCGHLGESEGTGPVWLMGDFNSPSKVRGEGYDRVIQSGWLDTYTLAAKKDGGDTVEGVIDGWKERDNDRSGGMRLDYIFCNQEVSVIRSQVVCNGNNYPEVSDHYGILVDTGWTQDLETRKER